MLILIHMLSSDFNEQKDVMSPIFSTTWSQKQRLRGLTDILYTFATQTNSGAVDNTDASQLQGYSSAWVSSGLSTFLLLSIYLIFNKYRYTSTFPELLNAMRQRDDRMWFGKAYFCPHKAPHLVVHVHWNQDEALQMSNIASEEIQALLIIWSLH